MKEPVSTKTPKPKNANRPQRKSVPQTYRTTPLTPPSAVLAYQNTAGNRAIEQFLKSPLNTSNTRASEVSASEQALSELQKMKLDELDTWYQRADRLAGDLAWAWCLAWSRLLFALIELPEGIGHNGPKIAKLAFGFTEFISELHHFKKGPRIISMNKIFVPARFPWLSLLSTATQIIFGAIWNEIDRDTRLEQLEEMSEQLDKQAKMLYKHFSPTAFRNAYQRTCDEIGERIRQTKDETYLAMIQVPVAPEEIEEDVVADEIHLHLLRGWILCSTSLIKERMESRLYTFETVEFISSAPGYVVGRVLGRIESAKTGKEVRVDPSARTSFGSPVFDEDFVVQFYRRTCQAKLGVKFLDTISYSDIENERRRSAIVPVMSHLLPPKMIPQFRPGQADAIMISVRPRNLIPFPRTSGLVLPEFVEISWYATGEDQGPIETTRHRIVPVHTTIYIFSEKGMTRAEHWEY
jgi:hypothetical protein